MKVLIVDSQNSGCWWHRGLTPSNELRKLGHEVEVVEPSSLATNVDFGSYEVVIISRGLGGTIDPLLLGGKFYRRAALVYETDDALELASYGNVYHEAIKPMLFNYFRSLEYARLVTTTTPALAEHVSYLGGRADRGLETYVYPNSLDLSEWRERPRESRQKLRIGYAGSNTHLRDIQPFLEGLIRLQGEFPGATELVIFGFTGGGSAMDFRENVRSQLGPMHYIHPLFDDADGFCRLAERVDCLTMEPVVSFQAYPERLSSLDLDLGVCPLEDTKFNRLKSAVKLYEYAAVGTPCLASNVGPYAADMERFPGSLVPHTAEGWYRALRAALGRRERIDGIGRKQREWVLAERDVRKTAPGLAAALERAAEANLAGR